MKEDNLSKKAKILNNNESWVNFQIIHNNTESNIITNNPYKATAFNNFLSQASISDNENAFIPHSARIVNDNNLDVISVTCQDIIDQLKSLDTSRSFGL